MKNNTINLGDVFNKNIPEIKAQIKTLTYHDLANACDEVRKKGVFMQHVGKTGKPGYAKLDMKKLRMCTNADNISSLEHICSFAFDVLRSGNTKAAVFEDFVFGYNLAKATVEDEKAVSIKHHALVYVINCMCEWYMSQH